MEKGKKKIFEVSVWRGTGLEVMRNRQFLLLLSSLYNNPLYMLCVVTMYESVSKSVYTKWPNVS